MATIGALTLYPIKSCAGIVLQEATLTRHGLAVGDLHDRGWMVVDESGRFMTQREMPRMALITLSVQGELLAVSAPGMAPLMIALTVSEPAASACLTVQVWDDSVQAVDCGASCAAWFSQVLGTPCRLVRFHPDALRLASEKWTGAVAAPTRFSDAFPVLLVGSASLDDLNEKLDAAGRAPLPMNRFRPNLVIDGIDAFEEDYAESFTIGAAELKPVKPCARCPIPSVDQASGQFGPDPLDILQTYRAKAQMDGAVCFGVNGIVISGAGQLLHVGQEVQVTLAF